jgi:Kef-type K+ transport system membrane component KefB
MLKFKLPDLPFNEPVVVFTILITIILLAPIIFKKIRIPGIVGLIIAGMVIGPNGLNMIASGESIKLLSTAGLLYLMFLTGLELSSRELIRNRNKSIVFGTLTFLIPLITGYIIAHFLFSYNAIASLLIGGIFATHTLISYPIASRLGITRSEVVTVSIGGTIITDIAVLVLLALITAINEGSLSVFFWLQMLLSLTVFAFIILWGVPKISTWFFKNLEGESGSQYIFVLAMLFVSGLLASAAGIEPIIGAFLAGLALNRLIPSTSALMNRVSFIGNNFFIPIFLISVGMMVDFGVLFKGANAFIFAGILLVIAIATKFIAAWLMQMIYKYTKVERQVIFGLSVSRAAVIIAVVFVGYDQQLIGLDVLNGAFMIVLVSCFIGSFMTEKAGRKLAVTESEKIPSKAIETERILVPVSNPATIELLIDFAILIRLKRDSQPVYMLSVVPDDDFAEEQILKNNNMFEAAISHAAAADTHVTLVSRVDLNVANGISRAVKELMINKIILGWNGKITTSNFFFGSIIENLIGATEQMVMVVKAIEPVNTIKRIVVLIPQNAECETGFVVWLNVLMIIAERTSSKLIFWGYEKAISEVRIYSESDSNIKTEFQISESSHPLTEFSHQLNNQDLLVVIAARRRTLSYNHYLDHMPRDLARNYENKNFIIIYPEQKNSGFNTLSSSFEGIDVSSIHEEMERFSDRGQYPRKPTSNKHNSITE